MGFNSAFKGLTVFLSKILTLSVFLSKISHKNVILISLALDASSPLCFVYN